MDQQISDEKEKKVKERGLRWFNIGQQIRMIAALSQLHQQVIQHRFACNAFQYLKGKEATENEEGTTRNCCRGKRTVTLRLINPL